MTFIVFYFFFKFHGDHRDLHVRTHSFPTRRSSDLQNSATDSRRQDRGCRRPWLQRADLSKSGVRPATADCAMAPQPSRKSGEGSSIIWTRWRHRDRSEEHTSELQSLMRNSYAVFCLKKKKITQLRDKAQSTI